MGSEHDEWLEHEKARQAAEHDHLMELMKHSKINSEHALEARRRARQNEPAPLPEEEEKKWTESTDDDEYFE